MGEKASFFVLRAKAVPEVLLRVVEAKRLLDSGKVESVQEATEMVQLQTGWESAAVLSTNIRTIYFHIMKMQKEKRSIW